jgi:hypothetical protein
MPSLGFQSLLVTVLRTYEARESKRNPIYLKLKRKLNKGHSTKGVTEGSGEVFEDEAELAWKGNKEKTWAGNPTPLSNRYVSSFRVYNGESEISHFGETNQFTIRRSRSHLLEAEPPWSIAGEEGFLEILRKADKKQTAVNVVSRTSQKDSSGEDLSVLVLYYPESRTREKAWLSPANDWLPRRLECYYESGELASVWVTSEFMNVDGFPFQRKGKRSSYYRDGKLIDSIEYEVTHVVLDPREIRDALFQVRFPPDAEFWDDDRKVIIRNLAVAEESFRELVAKAGPSPSWVWYYGSRTLVLGGAMLLAIGFWSAMRRMVRRAKSQAADDSLMH